MAEDPLRHAYNESALTWATGPVRIYRWLAEALVSQSPVSLEGALVLDVGAGTGVASEVVDRLGGRCVGLDVSSGMLRQGRAWWLLAVQGDAMALPFRDDAFDAVVAAFSLSHMPDPQRMLGEAGRVTTPGGVVLVSAFRRGWDHPCKGRVEEALLRFGYQRPDWYLRLKEALELLVGEPEHLLDLAQRAGLMDAQGTQHTVDTGVRAPEEMAAWRLGMAQCAPFVSSLSPAAQEALWNAVVQAIGPEPEPVAPDMLVLSARAG